MITTAEFLRTVRDIVADRGADFVYPADHASTAPSCRYDTGNSVRCLIGEVMHRHGVSDEVLTDWTVGESTDDVSGLIDKGHIKTATVSTARLMTLAQRMQDSGVTYGIIQSTLAYARDLM